MSNPPAMAEAVMGGYLMTPTIPQLGRQPYVFLTGTLNLCDSLLENLWLELTTQQAPDEIREVVLTISLCRSLGSDGMLTLARRFKALANCDVVAIYDHAEEYFRFMPVSALGPNLFFTDQRERIVRSLDLAMVNGQISSLRPKHIPRPPNSFICYRQHHHRHVADSNPGLSNCEISKIIGKMWKEESAEARARFREIADHMKRQHMIEHPDYQYVPRRPGTAKRQSVRAQDCWCISRDTNGGAQLYFHAVLKGDGLIDINDHFVSVLNNIDALHGPNGLAPMNTFSVVPDAMQPSDEPGNVVLNPLNLPQVVSDLSPIGTDWFGPDFLYTEVDGLLHLEGAEANMV